MTNNASEPLSTPSTNTSNSDIETKDQDDKSMSQDQKIQLPSDIESALNKYRRNGVDVDYSDRWEDERKRYLEYPERNHYEYDYNSYHRERNRFPEKTHPVRVQGCGHYSRDVSRDEGVIRSGILQGWLGAARTGNGNEDKRLDMSPFYVSTATPKTASSYRNPANKQNSAEYDQNSFTKPKYSANGNYRVKGSASKEYYNLQGGNYNTDDRNPVGSWQLPAKNNRVVYYEYNLDDRRPDSGFYSQDYPSNYDQCENEYDENSRKPVRNQYKNRYPSTSTYGSSFIPQSRLSTSFNPEPNERQYQSYYSDDSYQNRNVDRGDTVRNSAYDYNTPFTGAPNDRLPFPSVSPTYMPQAPFVSEGSSERQGRGDVKPIPFNGHRFSFQPGNL